MIATDIRSAYITNEVPVYLLLSYSSVKVGDLKCIPYLAVLMKQYHQHLIQRLCYSPPGQLHVPL